MQKNCANPVTKPVKKATKTAGKVVTAPVRAVFAPVRWTSQAFNAVSRFINKIKLKVLAVGIIVVVFYFVLIFLLGSLFQISSGTADVYSSTPFLENIDIKDKINLLNGKNDEKYKEAFDVANGVPMTQEVFGGEKIYHYGSPESKDDPKANMYHNNIPGSKTDNGYHIYFIDSKGNVLGSNTTNTKDIICLTSVMFDNHMYKDNTKTLKPEFNEVLEKWSKILNPEVTYIESDIYHARGTDKYPHAAGKTYQQEKYYCNDAEFYRKYNRTKNGQEVVHGQRGGVKFFTTPRTQTEKGCKIDWDAYDEAYDFWRNSRPEPPYRSWLVDYEPEAPDYSMYDDYWDYLDAYYEYRRMVNRVNEAIREYNRAYNRYCDDLDDWYDSMPNYDDFWYCPGHPANNGYDRDIDVSYGYRDIDIFVTVLTKDDVYEAYKSNNGVIKYKVPKNTKMTEWKEKTVDCKPTQRSYSTVMKSFLKGNGWKNEAHIEWCEAMYDRDWYEMFGVDVYRDSVGLNNGSGTLTPRQINELLDSYKGKLTSSRKSFINFALTYVGQIDYYFGGKASKPGFSGNDFGSRVEPDEKGRTLKGLDCSGFVSWVYWSVFNVKPGMSSSSFVSSLHLTRTTSDKLVPGDIGMANLPGATENHIGIFVGYDENTGRAKWVHSSGSPTNKVVCNTTNIFRYYYSLGK